MCTITGICLLFYPNYNTIIKVEVKLTKYAKLKSLIVHPCGKQTKLSTNIAAANYKPYNLPIAEFNANLVDSRGSACDSTYFKRSICNLFVNGLTSKF